MEDYNYDNMEAGYDGVVCSECGWEVCGSCGCCCNSSCEMGCCPETNDE